MNNYDRYKALGRRNLKKETVQGLFKRPLAQIFAYARKQPKRTMLKQAWAIGMKKAQFVKRLHPNMRAKRAPIPMGRFKPMRLA